MQIVTACKSRDEYADFLEVDRDIQRKAGVSWFTLSPSLVSTFSILQAMHQANWVHLDIKAENILLSQAGQPKLADFGTSRELETGPLLIPQCGTRGYMVRTSQLIWSESFERAS